MGQQENGRGLEDTVVLEFYSKDDGSDQFSIELTVADFERYQLAASNMGVSFEDFMVDVAEAELREQNTQWFVPEFDENDNITLEGATEIPRPDLRDLSGDSKGA